MYSLAHHSHAHHNTIYSRKLRHCTCACFFLLLMYTFIPDDAVLYAYKKRFSPLFGILWLTSNPKERVSQAGNRKHSRRLFLLYQQLLRCHIHTMRYYYYACMYYMYQYERPKKPCLTNTPPPPRSQRANPPPPRHIVIQPSTDTCTHVMHTVRSDMHAQRSLFASFRASI